jgi:hypothetical protein
MTTNPILTEEQFSNILTSYRQSVANKFANPYLFSLIAMMYAYRGKISTPERILLAGASIATVVFIIRKNKDQNTAAIAASMYSDYKNNLLKTISE